MLQLIDGSQRLITKKATLLGTQFMLFNLLLMALSAEQNVVHQRILLLLLLQERTFELRLSRSRGRQA